MNDSPIGDLIYGTLAALAVLIVGGVHILAENTPGASGPNQTALIFLVNSSSTASSSLATDTPNIFSTVQIKPNLLPKVLPKWLVIKKMAAAKPLATQVAGSSPTTVVPKTTPITTAQIQAATQAQASSSVNTALPNPITASWFLSQTTASYKPRNDGGDDVVFTTSFNGQTLDTWHYGDLAVGGVNGTPAFNPTYDCTPLPFTPDVTVPDQSPIFSLDTTYNCTLTLTPTTGDDLRTQSKTFTVQTAAGKLVAGVPTSMKTLLTNDMNNGGITLNNEDVAPVTITSLTLDITFQGLSTTDGPLVLRIQDPKTETSIGDFHVESASLADGSTSTYETVITAPVNITIPGQTQKLIPMQALGVHKLSILGLNPTFTIGLQALATNRSDLKVDLNNAAFTWSCIVDFDPNDPVHPTGAFAAGTACLQ